MKKFIVFLMAILFLGVATPSQAYFGAADAQTTESSGSVKVTVYNNSGSDLDVGDVVVWDIGSSTGDNDLYITTTTTADTGIVAGVVYPSAISTGNQGAIVVYGFAECDTSSLGINAGGTMCTSGTAGAGDTCANAGTAGNNAYAIASAVGTASAQVNCFIDVK